MNHQYDIGTEVQFIQNTPGGNKQVNDGEVVAVIGDNEIKVEWDDGMESQIRVDKPGLQLKP